MYFPEFNGEAECHKCELETCHSRGKFQRNKRDFKYTSGRCPKLPDMKGFVHTSQRANQLKAYPLIHAESNDENVFLSLSIPGNKKLLKVYSAKGGNFYFRAKDEDGNPIKRIIFIGYHKSHKDIMEFMQWRNADYCIFPCEITEFLA